MKAECWEFRKPRHPVGHALATLLGVFFFLIWSVSPAAAEWRATDREAVGRLQHQLDWIGRHLGFGNVTADGALGPQTRNAVGATARFYGIPFDAMPFADMAGGIAAVHAGFDGAAWLELNVADNRPVVPPAAVQAPALDPGLRARMTLGPVRMDTALPQAAGLAYVELLTHGAGPPLSDSVYMTADDTPPGSYRRNVVVMRPDAEWAIVLYRNADQASNTVSAAEVLRRLGPGDSTRALLDWLAEAHGPPAWGEQIDGENGAIRLVWPVRPTEAPALANCVSLLLDGSATGAGRLDAGPTTDPASLVGPLLTPSPEIRHAPCGPLRVVVLGLDETGAPQLLREIIADTDELARVWLARLGADDGPDAPSAPAPEAVAAAAGPSDFLRDRCDRIVPSGGANTDADDLARRASALERAEIEARLAAETGRFEPDIDAATRIGLARDMLEIAQATGDGRAGYEAQARLLRALNDTGRRDEAAALALALMPVAVARLAHSRDWAGPGPDMADPDPGARHGMGSDPRSLRDCWAIYGVMDSLLAALPLDAEPALFAQAAFWRGHEIALFADLGSDQPFWAQLSAIKPLLGSDLREIMRFMARTAGHHQDIDTPPEIYMARRAAEYLEAVLEPAQARPWRALVAEWQGIGAADPVSGATATAAEALRLADLNEAVGNQAAAIGHLLTSWEMSAREGDGPTATQIEHRLHDHLLGRYCARCDDGLAPLLAAVWARNMDRPEEPLLSQSGPSRAFALYLSRSESTAVSDALRAEAQAILARPIRFDARSDRDIEARFDREGIAPERRLMLRLLMNYFPESGLRTLDAFLEGDAEGRRRQLADHVYGVVMHFDDLGVTAAGFDAFHAYLQLLDAAGEAEAARIVARALVELSREALSVPVGSTSLRWQPPSADGRVALAHVLAPVLARMARSALIEGRPDTARAHLADAQALIDARLSVSMSPEESILLQRHLREATLVVGVLAGAL